MRFMMQYDPGHGDYSKERHEIFAALTIDELTSSMVDESPEAPASES